MMASRQPPSEGVCALRLARLCGGEERRGACRARRRRAGVTCSSRLFERNAAKRSAASSAMRPTPEHHSEVAAGDRHSEAPDAGHTRRSGERHPLSLQALSLAPMPRFPILSLAAACLLHGTAFADIPTAYQPVVPQPAFSFTQRLFDLTKITEPLIISFKQFTNFVEGIKIYMAKFKICT